jgi:hypothetical protein
MRVVLVDGVGIGRVEIELECGVTFGNDLLRLFRVIRRIRRVARVAIRVNPDLVAKTASEEGRDWCLQLAAHQIPESDLDAADRRHGGTGLRAFTREAADHDFQQPDDVGGVLANDERLCLVDKLGHTRAPIGLAQASNTVIGLHLDEHPGKIPGNDGCRDIGDLHGWRSLPMVMVFNFWSPAPCLSRRQRDGCGSGQASATASGQVRA